MLKPVVKTNQMWKHYMSLCLLKNFVSRMCYASELLLTFWVLGVETDGEVIDSCVEGMTEHVNDVSKSVSSESEEHSGASSELTESEPGDVEVQSAKTNIRGSLRL